MNSQIKELVQKIHPSTRTKLGAENCIRIAEVFIEYSKMDDKYIYGILKNEGIISRKTNVGDCKIIERMRGYRIHKRPRNWMGKVSQTNW